jgi:prepilin-type N-terminal cleavage/methylation domain-containing protein
MRSQVLGSRRKRDAGQGACKSLSLNLFLLRSAAKPGVCVVGEEGPRTGSKGRGFTLVETLLALAISAMLLAAVATAFNASVISYHENERMYDSLNNARQAMLRMTTQLRTGYAVDPSPSSVHCNFFTADDEDITYEYRIDARQLVLITNVDHQEYVLCNNVAGLTFTKVPTDDGTDCKSVRISMTVQSGNRSQTLSSAAVIRRNLAS